MFSPNAQQRHSQSWGGGAPRSPVFFPLPTAIAPQEPLLPICRPSPAHLAQPEALQEAAAPGAHCSAHSVLVHTTNGWLCRPQAPGPSCPWALHPERSLSKPGVQCGVRRGAEASWPVFVSEEGGEGAGAVV